MNIKSIHKNKVMPGDTILHNGEIKTVSANNIKNGFCGVTIFGDSYNLGYKLVKRVIL